METFSGFSSGSIGEALGPAKLPGVLFLTIFTINDRYCGFAKEAIKVEPRCLEITKYHFETADELSPWVKAHHLCMQTPMPEIAANGILNAYFSYLCVSQMSNRPHSRLFASILVH